MLPLYFYLLTFVFLGVHVAFVFLSFDVFICVGCVWLLFIRGIVSGDCEPCIVLPPHPHQGSYHLPLLYLCLCVYCVCVFVFVFVFVTILHCVSPPPPCSAAST